MIDDVIEGRLREMSGYRLRPRFPGAPVMFDFGQCGVCYASPVMVIPVSKHGDGTFYSRDLCQSCFERFLKMFKDELVALELMED